MSQPAAAAAAAEVILEFHGGPHDGLVLATPQFVPVVPLPVDRVISNLQDYAAWTPKDGDQLHVYEFRDGPRPWRDSGIPAFHLHLDRTVTLHEIGPTNP